MRDYEDAVMAETAFREDINYIITRNVTDYELSPVKVLTPGQMLNALSHRI